MKKMLLLVFFVVVGDIIAEAPYEHWGKKCFINDRKYKIACCVGIFLFYKLVQKIKIRFSLAYKYCPYSFMVNAYWKKTHAICNDEDQYLKLYLGKKFLGFIYHKLPYYLRYDSRNQDLHAVMNPKSSVNLLTIPVFFSLKYPHILAIFKRETNEFIPSLSDKKLSTLKFNQFLFWWEDGFEEVNNVFRFFEDLVNKDRCLQDCTHKSLKDQIINLLNESKQLLLLSHGEVLSKKQTVLILQLCNLCFQSFYLWDKSF